MNTHTHTHTPGPWSVETKGSRHFIDGADELTVAYVDRAGVRERQTYEANAHLIAAAPELLAALHLARIAINADALADSANNGSSWFKARAVALDKIDAAISKAEGQA